MRYFFAILIIFGVTYFVTRSYLRPYKTPAQSVSPSMVTPSVTVTVLPAAVAFPPAVAAVPPQAININSVYSPDGKMKVELQAKIQANKSTAYSIFTETGDGRDKKLLYATNSADGNFSLSDNSWSPDDAYVFLLHKYDGIVDGLVLKVNSVNNEPRQFVVSRQGISNITGWDADSLLHVRTRNIDGGNGPNFWFDVTSRSFIQLSS